MNEKTLLVELLLAGFFAVACLRARAPVAGRDHRLGDAFRLLGRIERFRRSRWEWFAMVALMLALRLQHQLPLVLEPLVLVELALFAALPKGSPVAARVP